MKYRKITPADDVALAKIIRSNLEKAHLNLPGTVYFDPELDHLSQFYTENTSKRVYYVALGDNDEVIGGIGIAEFSGLPDCAELQKLYLADSAKGKGYSRVLVGLAERWARDAQYQNLYLETHTNLEVAIKLYEKLGFKQIEKPEAVCHDTMDHFYLKSLMKVVG